MYREVLRFLGNKGAFAVGITIAKEEERLAELQGNLEDIIHANESLSWFYYFSNQMQEVYRYLEKLVVLYEQAGMHHKAIEKRFHILGAKVWSLGNREALKGLYALLDEAKELGHELTIIKIRAKLVETGESLDSIAMLREEVGELEKIEFSDPVIYDEYGSVYVMATGRARLLRHDGKMEEAKKTIKKRWSLPANSEICPNRLGYSIRWPA